MRRVGALAAAFALLAGCCGFLAMAGPRQDLAARTQALRQTVAALPATSTAIGGGAQLNQAINDLNDATDGSYVTALTPAQLNESIPQLQAQLTSDGLKLASGAWAGITSELRTVASPVPGKAAPAGTPPKLEIAYRSDLTGFTRLVSGSYPSGSSGHGLGVVVTQATAALLDLHPGSTLTIPGELSSVTLTVTGIVRPVGPDSTFWISDVLVAAPGYVQAKSGYYWDVGMLTDDSQAVALQNALGLDSQLAWSLPLDLDGPDADQVPALANDLQTVTTQTVELTGDIAAMAPAVSLTQNLSGTLTTFLQTETSTEDLNWLVFISLAATAAAVLLLAARLLTASRRDELSLLRARGASARQVFLTQFREFGPVCLVSCAVAAGLGLVAADGRVPTPEASWLMAGAVAVIAVIVPPVLAVAAVRGSATRAGATTGGGIATAEVRSARRARVLRRIIIEASLVLAAIAGLVVYRQHPASVSGVNPFASAAPVLVAVPVVIVVARLTPLVVGLIRRLTGRRSGAPVFIALARAARPAALTVFAIVMALTLCAFGGMVRDAIVRGEVSASWQQAGADDSITASGSGWFTPSAQAAITGLPGVQESAAVWSTSGDLANGDSVIVLAVNPASYAAFTASSPGWPKISAARLTSGAIVSPQLAAEVTGGRVSLTGDNNLTAGKLTARITGTVTETPALPGGSLFMIVSLAAVSGNNVQDDLMLLNGTSISPAALSSVVAKTVPGAVIQRRNDILNSLLNAPLQRGTYIVLLLGILAAALLAGAAAGCELAYGAAERDATLARLTTMGLTERQRVGLIAVELAPGLLSAAVAAAVSSLALPSLLASALDLSVFTGSGSPVPIRPDVLSIALPIAALLLLAAGSVLFGARRKNLVSRLRMGGR
jgi:putative ABC transport system permease protein